MPEGISEEGAMKLYVIRHGQTDWNINRLIQGQTDIALNEAGFRQAEDARKALSGVSLDVVFTSPLVRARRTAEIICRDRDLPVFVDDRLQERSYGELEGTDREAFPYNELWEYDRNLILRDVEPVKLFFQRVYSFLDEISLKYLDKNVLLVTHTGVLKAVECYANGMLPDKEIGPFIPENARVSEYCLKGK